MYYLDLTHGLELSQGRAIVQNLSNLQLSSRPAISWILVHHCFKELTNETVVRM
jgi:hypothetical protein